MNKKILNANVLEKKFWNWFEKNNTHFLNLHMQDSIVMEKLIDEILTELHLFSENIWVQVGGESNNISNLIFTAEGNIEYFNTIKILVKEAPKIENWNFIALIPPLKIDTISYDNFSIHIDDIFFTPTLICGLELDEIAVTIKIKGYTAKNKFINFKTGVHKFLEVILGEELFSNITYIDIEKWDKKSIPNINELKDYIERRINTT